MSDRDKAVRRSAELLKHGAKMLSLQCPICGSPLFKLKNGEIVCPIHGKVHVVTDEKEVVEEVSKDILAVIMEKVVSKLKLMASDMMIDRTPREEADYAEAFLSWLKVLEKIRDLRKKERVKEESGKKE